VWVHERGAPHLADPSKLLESAGRLYGADMERLWGSITPVPERNLLPLKGGEVITVGDRELEVAYAPGHASHHVVYLDRSDRTAYVGDVAGVRIAPSQFTVAPTPPPDIDVTAWQRSLATVRDLKPARLALTHFGMVEDAEGQIEAVSGQLRRQAGLARALLEREADEDAAAARFVERIEQDLQQHAGPETVAVYLQAAPPEQLWLGLRRYLEKGATAKP
jgi:glyoxylase-like metal-dependent hydrolase (beta-lactamase superfamily II)